MHIFQNTPREILFAVCKGYEKALFSEGVGGAVCRFVRGGKGGVFLKKFLSDISKLLEI
jgi:hypothetical protein